MNIFFKIINNKIFKGFKNQYKVINALVYRELRTRISQVKFGFFGVLLQPLGSFILFLLIFGFIRQRGGGGIDPDFVPIFLITGIIHYTLFTEIVIRSVNSMQANEALLFYRQVKPVDTIISRVYVECLLFALVLIFLVVGIFLLFEIFTLDNLPLVVGSYLTLTFSSLGIGIFFMVAGYRYPLLKTIIIFIQRPLFLTSGVFFSINNIPQSIRPWLSWNPILQSIELSRKGFNEKYFIDPEVISLSYAITFALLSCSIGLWVYSNNQKILRRL
mgnify:FL=1